MAEDSEENKEVELEDVKMVDGTILRVEPAIEVGATVQVIGEDGELIDAPDGDHELEDGRVLKTEGGIAVEIIEVEGAEEEEVVEEEMSEEAPVEETAQPKLNVEELQNQLISKLNDSIAQKIDNLKFAKQEQIETLKSENKELKETLVEVVEMFEQFSASESVTPKKTPTNAWMSKDSAKVNYSELLKKTKNK